MSTISVGSLPVVDELFEDDMVLVQAKDRTGLLKFSDFVIGEQQVSFYQEIVNARNGIAGVSQITQQNTAAISTNAELIAELQTTASNNSTSIESIQTANTVLQDQNTNMQSSLSAVTTLANSVLNTSVNKLSEATAANTELSTKYASLTGTFASMNEQIQDLQSTVNNINNSLYTQQQQIDTLLAANS
jgi:chromosome segregation ATPase